MLLRAFTLICLLALAPAVTASDYAMQRALFKRALGAIDNRDALRVAGLTLALGDYPLIDYLHYRWLRERLRDGEQLDDEIRDYITYYPGRFAERLRGRGPVPRDEASTQLLGTLLEKRESLRSSEPRRVIDVKEPADGTPDGAPPGPSAPTAPKPSAPKTAEESFTDRLLKAKKRARGDE